MIGFVWLVGAGCGRPDLLTLAGFRALQDADVVVYDDLLAPGILEYAAPEAEKRYVGKRLGKHSAVQEEISGLLVSLARAGKRVCRLKGGDPFVFGRGGEEALALQAAQIPYTIIPGVTSAVAVPELAGIPVTHRAVSRSFHVVTGHTASGPDGLPPNLDALATVGGTLVFLMGLNRLSLLAQRLIDGGMAPDTPAAVVGETAVRGTLADIGEKAADFPPPAVIVVGETAKMELLSPHLPLAGVTIGLTGTQTFQDKLRRALAPYGGQVVSLQTSAMEPVCTPEKLSDALAQQPRWVAFTSPNGVQVFFELLAKSDTDLRDLAQVKFAVVGKGTAKALRSHGIHADLIPERHYTAALGAALAEVGESPVLLAGAENASAAPEEALAAAGVPCSRLDLYRLTPGPVQPIGVDYLLFGSAGGVENYFAAGGRMPRRSTVCIGENTAQRAAQLGCSSLALAKDATGFEMAQALLKIHKEAQK